MDEDALMREKLDPRLYEKVKDESPEQVNVIIQTVDGLKDDDRKLIATLGGKVKDDLYIINAYSAEIPINSVRTLILSPRVLRVFYDAEVRAI